MVNLNYDINISACLKPQWVLHGKTHINPISCAMPGQLTIYLFSSVKKDFALTSCLQFFIG